MFIKGIAKLFIAINANTKPGQISGGIACAFLLALVPSSHLLWYTIFLFLFFLKINLAVVFIFTGIFSLLTPLLDGPLNRVGLITGYLPGISDFFGFLDNVPVLAFFGFDNSLVLGGLIVGIITLVPVYFLSNGLVSLYRKKVRDRFAKSRLIKRLLLIPIIGKLVDAIRTAYTLYADAG